jgi:hypothetical protein
VPIHVEEDVAIDVDEVVAKARAGVLVEMHGARVLVTAMTVPELLGARAG